ncbi:MAG: PilN domain-containing protein [Gammaproteobacteria bacterium]
MTTLIDNLKIRENYDWWRSELAGMLPNLNIQSGSNSQVFSIELSMNGYQLNWHEADKQVASQSKFDSSDAVKKFNDVVGNDKNLSVSSCTLRIASHLILSKEISLPSATEENLENVIAYEIDRYTPFKKEDVYFSVQVKDRDKKEKKINVLLNVVKKSLLDDVLKFAESCDLSIDNVFNADNDERIYFVDFLGNQQQNKKKNSLDRFLLIAMVILFITALALPIGKNYWVGKQLQERFTAKESEIAEVKELLAEYKAVKNNAELVEQLSLNNIKVMKLLNDLTKIIPNDTSLNRLSMEDGVVRIQGLSSEASKLLPLLDSANNFSAVRFVAPVSQSGDSNKEKFTIEIKLLQIGENHADG